VNYYSILLLLSFSLRSEFKVANEPGGGNGLFNTPSLLETQMHSSINGRRLKEPTKRPFPMSQRSGPKTPWNNHWIHTYNTIQYHTIIHIVQELCESRGGRPELSVLTSLLVSVDVKNY